MTPPRANSLSARDAAAVLHPYTDLKHNAKNGPLVITRGKGVRVFDDAGKGYIETVAGLWCASLGFDNERLVQAAMKQMRELPFYHGFTGRSSTPQIELAEMLLERAPVKMSKVFFANSGSEANDTAIKMIWFMNNGLERPKKKKIIGRIRGYHGITIASASVTGQAANHRSFDVPLPGFAHTICPSHYHAGLPGETEEDFATRCAEELEKLIIAEGGAEHCAAMFCEPIQGAGGVVVPPRTYFEKIQPVLKKYDMLLVADEVICGFFRTGNYWGSQTFNMQPDILVCAKALSSSYLPISAVMVNDRVFEALSDQSSKLGTFGHGFTYSGHPVPAAVALETLKIYDEMDILSHVRDVGPHMQARLQALADHPLVGEVRGKGLVAAIELVADKAARRNYEPSAKVGPRLVKLAEENGLICRSMVMDSIGFSPPLIITKAEIDEMMDLFEQSLNELNVQLRREAIQPVA
jgi:4-aminobutyrate--pyruvate transaminase